MDKETREKYFNLAQEITDAYVWWSFNDCADEIEAKFGERPQRLAYNGTVTIKAGGWSEIYPVPAMMQERINNYIANNYGSEYTLTKEWVHNYISQRVTYMVPRTNIKRWYAADEPMKFPSLEVKSYLLNGDVQAAIVRLADVIDDADTHIAELKHLLAKL